MNWKSGKILGIFGEEGCDTLLRSLFTEDGLGETALVSEAQFFPKGISHKEIDRFFTCYDEGWSSERFFDFLSHHTAEGYTLPLAVAVGRSARVAVCDPLSEESAWDPQPILDFCALGGGVVIGGHTLHPLEEICDDIGYVKGGKLLFCAEKVLLLEEYGRVSCPRTALSQIHREDYLYMKFGEHSATLLVKNCEDFNGRYPAFRAEPTTLEQIFLLVEQGVAV